MKNWLLNNVLNLPAHAVAPHQKYVEVGSFAELKTLTRTFCPPSPNFTGDENVQNLASVFDHSPFDAFLFGNCAAYCELKCTQKA